MGLSNTWRGFTLDRAVAVYGNALKNELEQVEGKKKRDIERKREMIFDRWFPEARKDKRFKDPRKA